MVSDSVGPLLLEFFMEFFYVKSNALGHFYVHLVGPKQQRGELLANLSDQYLLKHGLFRVHIRAYCNHRVSYGRL